MPAPKSADRYSQVYWSVIQTARERPSEPLHIPFPSLKEAQGFRARLNFFRKALDYDSRRHADLDIRRARKDLFEFANKLRFKVKPKGDAAEVIIILVDKDVSATELQVEHMLEGIREKRHREEVRKAKGTLKHNLKPSSQDDGESLKGMFKDL